MSNDTETAMSSTGSVKIPLFKGDGTGVSFEDYWNKLEAGLEYNCLEHCIEAGFKATTKEEIEKEADTTKQEKLEKKYKEDHKARAIIKLSVDKGPLTMIKNCASAFEMVTILKREYKLGKKLYDHKSLVTKWNECKMAQGESPTIYFSRLDDINRDFELFRKTGGKDYKRDAAEYLMHIQDNVEEVYKPVWVALEVSSKDLSDEDKLKEAKLSLKEYWNENLKGESRKESTLIMYTTDNKPKCQWCGKAHKSDDCWIKYPDKRPAKKQTKKSSKQDNKDGCWKCGSKDHQKKDCPLRKNKQESSALNGVFVGCVACVDQDVVDRSADTELSGVQSETRATCAMCPKSGHGRKCPEENDGWTLVCSKKRKKSAKENFIMCPVIEETGVLAMTDSKVFNQKSWDGFFQVMGDTGAQSHVFQEQGGPLENVRSDNIQINGCMQNDQGSRSIQHGDAKLQTRDGVVLDLFNVKIVPDIIRNIISIGQLIDEGWKLEPSTDTLVLKKDQDKLLFKKIPGEERLFYLEAKWFEHTSSVNALLNDEDEDSDVDMPDLEQRKKTWIDYDSDSDDSLNLPPRLLEGVASSDSEDEDSSDDESSMPDLCDRFENSDSEDELSDTDDELMQELDEVISEMELKEREFSPQLNLAGNANMDSKLFKQSVNKKEKLKQAKKRLLRKYGKHKMCKYGLKRYIHMTSTSSVSKPNLTPIDKTVAHDQWGHHNKKRDKLFAKILGYELVGEDVHCDACGVAKAKRASVSKTTSTRATRPGERFFADTTGPFEGVPSHKRYMHGLVDDFSDRLFMKFSPVKKEMTKFVEEAFVTCQGKETPIKYVRVDGGGENAGIKALCQKYGATLEKTPPYTPQYNGKIERRFAVVCQMAMAFLWNAKFNKEHKQRLLPEAIEMASFLHDLLPTAANKKSHNERWYGEPSKWTPKHLIEFGRVGHVTIKEKKTAKQEPKSEPMIMVGYVLDAPVGTYKMYNPKTKRVITTDSVKWSKFQRWEVEGDLDEIFKDASKFTKGGLDTWDEYGLEDIIFKQQSSSVPGTPQKTVHFETGGTDDSDSGGTSKSSNPTTKTYAQATSSSAKTPVPPVPVRQSRRLRGLSVEEPEPEVTDVTPEPMIDGTNKVTGDTTVRRIEIDDGIMDIEVENKNEGGADDVSDAKSVHFVFNTSVNSDPGEPTTWEEARDGPESKLWTASTISEFNNFLKRKSWKFKPKSIAKDAGRKLIGTKLVFKKKDEADGTTRFKTRCVSKGFMQIPGVDYTERFSPVATDEALLMLIAMILFYWDSKEWRAMGLDVEAAFLEGSLDNPMYLQIPHALVDVGFITEEEYQELCIELQKGMYGNVDAALRFFIELTDYLTSESVGMEQSKVDPCVFFKKNEKNEPVIILVVTVDDCVMGGNPKDVQLLMEDIEKRFSITRDLEVKKHLGIDFNWIKEENGNMSVELTMEKKAKDIVESLEKFLGREIKTQKSPGKPHTVLIKNKGDVMELDMYRSLVGKLMFYTTKLGPDMAYAVRDLAAHMSNPGETHWEALERVVGYLKGKELKGIKLFKPEQLRIISACDADFAKCPTTRKSVGGELHTLGGCLIGFSSKGQTTVSLSSCESEYKAACSAVKSQKFCSMLLKELVPDYLELPCVLYEDNEGTIFLVYNKQVSQRTKHIDVATHFIREFCSPDKETGMTNGLITKIDTTENPADILTKNVDVKTFESHMSEMNQGFPAMRQKAFGANGTVANIGQKLLGGMSRSATHVRRPDDPGNGESRNGYNG